MPQTDCRHTPNCLVIQLQDSTPRLLRATSVHSTSLLSTLTHLYLYFYVQQIATFFLSSQLYHICCISGSHSGASEDSLLFGCESLSISERLPTFRTTAVIHVWELKWEGGSGWNWNTKWKWLYFIWQLSLVTHLRYFTNHIGGRLSERR
jgi:hypothetical protein